MAKFTQTKLVVLAFALSAVTARIFASPYVAIAPGLDATKAGAVRQERTERSLFEVRPVTGSFGKGDFSSHGRTFSAATQMIVGDQRERTVVWRLDEAYDRFEGWIGPKDPASGRDAIFEIVVLGDGEELFRRRFETQSKPEPFSVDIHGRKGLSIVSRGLTRSTTGLFSAAVIGDPVLVKMPLTIPSPLAPTPNERVRQRTPLVWRGVEGASGYLLELQCYAATSTDANSADRFLAKLLPGDATSYDFDTPTMPRGRWRWRVSALAPDGSFLGEAKEWSFFSTL